MIIEDKIGPEDNTATKELQAALHAVQTGIMPDGTMADNVLPLGSVMEALRAAKCPCPVVDGETVHAEGCWRPQLDAMIEATGNTGDGAAIVNTLARKSAARQMAHIITYAGQREGSNDND